MKERYIMTPIPNKHATILFKIDRRVINLLFNAMYVRINTTIDKNGITTNTIIGYISCIN